MSTIGKVSVRVFPNTKSFRSDLQKDLTAIEKSVKDMSVEVKADTAGMVSKVKAAKKAAEKGPIRLSIDEKHTNESLRKNIAILDKELKKARMYEMDIGFFNKEEFEAEIRRLERDLTLDLSVDKKSIDSVTSSIKQVDREIAKLSEKEIRVRLNKDDLEDEKVKLEAALKRMERGLALEAKLKVREDRREVAAMMRRLKSEFDEITFHPSMDPEAKAKVQREMEDLLLKREKLKVDITPEMDPLKKRAMVRDLGEVEQRIGDIRKTTRGVNVELQKQHSFMGAIHKATREARDGAVEYGKTWDRVSVRVGKGLGEGSRNNMLNSFGRMARNLSLALLAPLKVMEMLTGSVKVGIATFKDLTEAGLSTGKALAGGVASGFASFTQSIPAMIAAVTGAVFALGSMALIVPVVTMLAGALAALASTILIALVGSIAPLIPLLAAMGLGLGVAAAAVIPLIEDIKAGRGHFKALGKDIDTLKGSVKRLGKEAAPALGRLTSTLVRAGDSMVRSFGKTVTTLFSDLDRKLNSPSMDKFYRKWKTEMPGIVENFGKGLNSLATGLIAFFAPVLDIAEDLAKKFKSAMDRFNEWAQSASGQNAIASFFEKAWDRAKTLWSTLKHIAKALANIITIGDEEAGGGFLESIEKMMEKFEKWTRKPLKLSDMVKTTGADMGTLKASGVKTGGGKSGLQEFFGDVDEFTRNLKTAATEVGKFFEELNKPENRENAKSLADSLGTIAKGLEWIARASSMATAPLRMIMDLFSGEGRAKFDWSAMFPDPGEMNLSAMGIVTGILTGLATGLAMIPGRLVGIVFGIPMSIINGIKSALGIHSPSTVMIGLMGDVAMGIIQGLIGIPGRIAGAVLGIGMAIVTGIRTAVSRVPGAMVSFAGYIVRGISSAIGPAVGAVTGLVGRIVGTLVTLPGRAAGAIVGFAGRILGVIRGAVGPAVGAVVSLVGRIVGTLTSLPGRAGAAIAGLAGRIGGQIATAAGRAVGATVGLVGRVVGTLTTLPGRAASAIAGLAGRLGGIVSEAGGRMVSAAGTGVGNAARTIGGLVSRAAGAISGLAGRLGGIASDAMGRMVGAVGDGVGRVARAAGELPGRIVGAVGSLGSLLYQVGADVVNGMVDGINDAAGRAARSAADMASGALAAAKRAIRSRSPSKDFMDLGRDSGAGLRIGIDKSHKGVAGAGKALGQSALDATRGVLEIHSPSRAFTRIGTQTVRGFTRGVKSQAKVSRKELVSSAKIIAKGFDLGLKFQFKNVKAGLDTIIKQIPKMTNTMARTWAANTARQMKSELKVWEKLHASWTQWTEKAKELRKAKAEFGQGMVDDALGIAGLGNIEGGFAEVIHRLTTAKEMTDEFAKYLTTLRKNGLRKDLYENIAAMGAEQGLAAAKAIADAGKKGVNEVNKLQADLLKSSSKSADQSSSHLYDAGINMATSIANGFAKEMNATEKRLLRMARNLAKNINTELRTNGYLDRVSLPSPNKSSTNYALQSSGTTKIVNYYAAPGSSMESEKSLRSALKKAGF